MRQPTNPLPDPDVPSAAKHLHCSLQGQAQVLDADYWRQLCPALHVDDEALQKRSKPLSLSKVENGHIRRQVDTEGVAQASNRVALDVPALPTIADVLHSLALTV